ncbi:MAG: DedA family protein [Deltaproteobacteria bacterium]|nr:DedA family protein [Deltaproteobacteria bacterium]
MHGLGRTARRLYDWVLGWAGSPYALAALAVLSFAEASFFPVPPDVLLIAMCLGSRGRSFWFAGVCSIASVFGGLAGYGIGAFLWGHVDQFFYSYIPGFTPARFEQVRALYLSWGIAIVFTAGFSPIPYKLFTIASGVMAMPLLPFLAASAVSRSARFFLVAGLIYKLGDPVKVFIDKYFNWLALAFSVLLVGGFVVLKWLL